MLKRTERLIISAIIFVASVLIFTRLDYLVNSDFYNFGLQFSNIWYGNYGFLYMALYQVVLVCLVLYSHNVKLFAVLEAFVLSAGPDLIYFGLWNNGVFPTGAWYWMPNGPLNVNLLFSLSSWTTSAQFILTISLTILVLVAVTVFPSKKLGLNAKWRLP